MKRYIRILLGMALVGSASFIMSHTVVLARGQAVQSHINGQASASSAIALANSTRGVVFKTAAINPDASVAACFRCNRGTTLHLGTGEYQIGFDEIVAANNGWSRMLQVDTLSTGSINNVSCSTADRSGLPSAIFVECYDGSGTHVDTSFFLWVAR